MVVLEGAGIYKFITAQYEVAQASEIILRDLSKVHYLLLDLSSSSLPLERNDQASSNSSAMLSNQPLHVIYNSLPPITHPVIRILWQIWASPLVIDHSIRGIILWLDRLALSIMILVSPWQYPWLS
jgi:hypothetical protein